MGFAMITLSEPAKDAYRRLACRPRPDAGLRLSLKTGGCAGMEYKLDIAEAGRTATTLSKTGQRVCSSSRQRCSTCLGTCMWIMRSPSCAQGFVFKNPNEVSACGCGESVELRPAEAATARLIENARHAGAWYHLMELKAAGRHSPCGSGSSSC
jgi:iron-sulfur cluster assembly protein